MSSLMTFEIGNNVKEKVGAKIGTVEAVNGYMIWVKWHPAWSEMIEDHRLELVNKKELLAS